MMTRALEQIKSLIMFILVTIALLFIRFLLFLVKITNKNRYESYCQLVRDGLDDVFIRHNEPDSNYKFYCFEVANVL